MDDLIVNNEAAKNSNKSDINVLLLENTSELVCAFLSKNQLPVSQLPTAIESIYSSLSGILEFGGAKREISQIPSVSIKRSIRHDYLICLEDGQKFKSMKRHLKAQYGLSPDEYRKKWGLSADYPMVAPGYSEKRSQLAKEMGLGRKQTLG